MKPCSNVVATVLPCLVMCTLLGFVPGAASAAIVHFPDHNLEVAVRGTIGKPAGDITAEDMGRLTSLSAQGQRIQHLTGLEYATNLQYLNLGSNQITDLIPLAGLKNLQTLDLANNEVSDLSPIAALVNLQYLNLGSNQITDLIPLAGLENLQYLTLGTNQVSDLSPLAGLKNLQVLWLHQNQFSDLSPLAGLGNLQILHLANNNVSDLIPLAGLENLQTLDLGNNEVSDLSPLAGLQDLQTLYLQWNQVSDLTPVAGLKNLQVLWLYVDQVCDLSPLAGLENLQTLDLGNNEVSDLSPLAGLEDLQTLNLHGNQVSDLSPLTALVNLQYLNLYNNQVSDISALVANSQAGGIGAGDSVGLDYNYLDLSEGSKALTDILALYNNGATVVYWPQNPVGTRVQTVVTLSAPSNATLDETVMVTSTLRDGQGNPLSGVALSYLMDSTSFIGRNVTDASGTASLSFKLTVGVGSHTIRAYYAGSPTYSTTSAESVLTVNPFKLTVTSSVPHAPVVRFNNTNFATDASGKATILVNRTGTYVLSINSPLLVSLGVRCVFVRWGDGPTGLSRQIVMDSDKSFTILTGEQYYLNVTSAYGTAKGSGWYDSASTAQFSIDPTVDHGNGTRRTFTGWWKDNTWIGGQPSGSLNITGPAAVRPDWKKQHYLKITTPHGNPPGEGWYDVGSSVTASIQSPFPADNGTRYITTGFTGTGSAPSSGTGTNVTFTLTTPSTLTYTWNTQHYLWVSSPYGSPEGEGWYDAGSTATFSVPVEVSAGEGIRHLFAGWTGSGTGSYTGPSAKATATMNSPIIETADWLLEYHLEVISPYGQPTGQGWYPTGSQATSSVTSPVSGTNGTRYVATGYQGTGSCASGTGTSATFTITSASSLTWNWKEQCQVVLVTSPTDLATPSGTGWYDPGSIVQISTPTQVIGAGDVRYIFQNWTGTPTPTPPESCTASVIVAAPCCLTANYQKLPIPEYSPIALSAVLFWMLLSVRRHQPSRPAPR